MKIRTIRFKASILFEVILGLVLTAYSFSLYFSVKHILYKDLERDLHIKTDQIAGILNAYAEASRIESHPLYLMRRLLAGGGAEPDSKSVIDKLWKTDVHSLNLKNDYFQVYNEKGTPILVSQNTSPEILKIISSSTPVSFDAVYYRNIHKDGRNLRCINVPFLYNKQTSLVIQLATPLQPLEKIMDELLFYIVSAVLIILAVTGFLGVFLTKSILKPVVSVIDAANAITHKDLTVRIQEKEIDQEMKALIHAFNTMIERLETSFNHINEFSSHVAHELKTPLAIMKGELELALSETRSTQEYTTAMRTVLEEIDRMVTTIKDLLLLAKLDYKPDIFTFTQADIVPFLHDIHEQCRILCIAKNISLNCKLFGGNVQLNYDPVHLRRLFLNLINNAIKFTPSGGTIDIELTVKGKQAVISVSDSGKGISQKDLAKIFNKFYRGSEGPQDSEPGSGLGLTIAQSIARAHNGTIQALSEPGKGAVFTVTLPLA